MTVTVPRQLLLPEHCAETIRRHATSAYPNECCGLLVGTGDEDVMVTEAVPLPNAATQPHNRFEIDPQGQFDLLRALRGTSRRIVGHFHSHPGGAALPSAHDRAMAHDFTAVWLIIATDQGGAGEMKSFICPGAAAPFVEIPIVAS